MAFEYKDGYKTIATMSFPKGSKYQAPNAKEVTIEFDGFIIKREDFYLLVKSAEKDKNFAIHEIYKLEEFKK